MYCAVMTGDRTGGPERGWLSSAEAARRLGIKQETLYAYVSRGMLSRRKDPGARESRFDPAEVARLSERRRSGSSRAGALEVVIDSALTLLDPVGRIWFRGWDVEEASRTASFEEVAEWLWTSPPDPAAPEGAAAGASPASGPAPASFERFVAPASDAARVASFVAPASDAVRVASFVAPASVLDAARGALASLAPGTPPIDRLRVGLAAAATADPLRFDRRPDGVAAAGRRIIAVLVDALPPVGGGDLRPSPTMATTASVGGGALGPSPTMEATMTPADDGGTVAERLWSRLSPTPAAPEQVAVLDAALVLLADHEMASSTLAARVAASTWADPYLVVTAGLAALGGPLHGSVGDRLVPVLHDAVARGAAEAIAERWRLGEKVWGFGHLVYTNRDPRAEALWPRLRAAWPESEIVDAAGEVRTAVTAHGKTFPNVDFMLAALVGAAGMAEGSAEVIFAVARTAGWLAHAIEEYEHALRFRMRAAYTGRAPAPGMPTLSRSR
jgi:citrate synthase